MSLLSSEFLPALMPAKAPADQKSIIFVHGFTGHPERTWTHKRGDMRYQTDNDELAEPPSKIRKLGLFSKPRQEDFHTAIYWPRDLLPFTAPNARVLTYGYDTHIRHK